MRIAIPTNNPGGLEAKRSDHFGHCDVFTVVTFSDDNQIEKVENVNNIAHDAGGCMVPVKVLADSGVDAIVVGGIGARPMQAFSEENITVYFADRNSIPNVEGVLSGFFENKLPIMRSDQACKGSSNCHH